MGALTPPQIQLSRGAAVQSTPNRELGSKALLSLLILTAVAFNPLGFDTTELPRVAIVKLAAAGILLAWIHGGARRLQLAPANIPLLLFLLLTALSVATSVGPYASFKELTLLLSVVIIFLAFREASARKHFAAEAAWVLVASGSAVAAYGVAQHFGFDFIPNWQDENISAKLRAMATFGNPIYLSSYMASCLSAATALFLGVQCARRKVLLGGAMVLMFTCLLFTQGRAGWLAFAVASTVVALVYGRQILKQWRWVLPAAAALALVFVLVEIDYSKSGQSVVARASSSLSRTDVTAAFRRQLWRAAVSAISERPLLGWGPGNFAIVLPRFTDSDLIARNEVNRAPAKCPHNELLNIAFSSGIPAALCWLWFIGSVFLLGIKRVKTEQENASQAALAAWLGVMTAYFVQSMFTPRLTCTVLPFWVAVAAIIGCGVPLREPLLTSRRLKTTATLGTAAAVALLVPSILRPLVADRYYNLADAYSRRERFGKALDYHLAAARWEPGNPGNWLGMAQTCYRAAYSPKAEPGPWLAFASMACNGALKLNPNDGFAHALAAEIYAAYAVQSAKGSQVDRKALSQALREYYTALSMYPRLSSLRNNIALFYQRLGRYPEAEREFRKAIALGSAFGEPEANLAKLLWRLGRRTEALKLLAEAEAKSPAINPYLEEYRSLRENMRARLFGDSHEPRG